MYTIMFCIAYWSGSVLLDLECNPAPADVAFTVWKQCVAAGVDVCEPIFQPDGMRVIIELKNATKPTKPGKAKGKPQAKKEETNV